MKKIIFAALLMLPCMATAQTEISKYKPGVTSEGVVYFLPKTALRIVVQVEKTTYTPGDFCKYSERYLRLKDVEGEASVSYKVNSVAMTAFGVADSSKCYAVKYNQKNATANVVLADDGTLLAINADALKTDVPAKFVPAKKPEAVNPRRFMNEDILTAGSTAKMAELTALEIYEIRDSKNQLTRGQADFMPKDGEQMKIMLEQLATQESALMQMFTGTVTKDTTEHVFLYYPDRVTDRQILFRLSNKLGIVAADDLAGAPYYISVTDESNLPETAPGDDKKKKKPAVEDGIYVNVPGKIKIDLAKGTQTIASFNFQAGQYGYTELLSGDLFNKRFTTHLTLNPITGGVAKLEAEQPK
ncbi:MAG: DUF4831 family protein [Prevotella sp.]